MAVCRLQFNRHRQTAETLPVLTCDYTTACLSFSRQRPPLYGQVTVNMRGRSIFSARQHMLSAVYAIARPSVCPSVRPSHEWISRKRLKLGPCNFHRTVASSLSCLQYKFHSDWIPRGWRQTRVGWGNELILSVFERFR